MRKILLTWIKKIVSFLSILPIRLNSNIKIKNVLFIKTKVYVAKTSHIEMSESVIINNSINIRGKNNSFIALNCSLTSSQILIDGDECHIILQEGTSIRDSKFVIRGSSCTICIGKNSTIGSNGEFVCMGIDNSLTIGEGCMIADSVDIWATDSHPLMDKKSGTILNSSVPVIVGNHVWIGKWASVLKGVRIGDDSVVGMKSIVTHDMEPSCIYAGIPAKKIKETITWDRNFIKQ